MADAVPEKIHFEVHFASTMEPAQRSKNGLNLPSGVIFVAIPGVIGGCRVEE